MHDYWEGRIRRSSLPAGKNWAAYGADSHPGPSPKPVQRLLAYFHAEQLRTSPHRIRRFTPYRWGLHRIDEDSPIVKALRIETSIVYGKYHIGFCNYSVEQEACNLQVKEKIRAPKNFGKLHFVIL